MAQVLPDHSVFGEEHGVTWGSGDGADYMWVMDPIDGTKSFITGGWVGGWDMVRHTIACRRDGQLAACLLSIMLHPGPHEADKTVRQPRQHALESSH